MRNVLSLVLSLTTLSIASPGSAQRTLAQDTMSMSTPVAIECGFCATEAYGVIFTRVGMVGGGLVPADFPLTVESISLAIGAADVTGTPAACHGLAAGGDAMVHFEIWAGATAPDAASIASMPVAGMPWPGEDLVYMEDDIPVTMSTPTADGAADFNLMLNTLGLGDSTTPSPRVDETHEYLRVVVVLGEGGMSSTCTPATNAPTGFPLRDADGVVAAHRSFIYATGVGWLWNEVAHVNGDWGIRLGIQSQTRDDSGVVVDAALVRDAGAGDAGVLDASGDASTTPDASVTPSGGGGACGCRAGSRSSSLPGMIAFFATGLALYGRKVTRPKRSGT